MQRKHEVTMKGKRVTLVGPEIKPGDKAPGFTVLSDHRDTSFGTAYSVLMQESRLLARAVFVIDRENTVHDVEIVSEVTDAPDYERALEEVKKTVS